MKSTTPLALIPSVAEVATKPVRLMVLVGPDLLAGLKIYSPPLGVGVSISTPNGPAVSVVNRIVNNCGRGQIARLKEKMDDRVKPSIIATFYDIYKATMVRVVGIRGVDERPQIIASAPWPSAVLVAGKSFVFLRKNHGEIYPGDAGAPVFVKLGSEWMLMGFVYSITINQFYVNILAGHTAKIPGLRS